MGKFSNYVDNINQQTELLRDNLSNASGVDCSRMSIGNCAQVVGQYITDKPEDEGYVRPDWYPNIKEILDNAPDIEKDGVTYYPLYITLLNNIETVTPFYRSRSTSAGVINYLRATGGYAVLCSDLCDNDITNASAETLLVGDTIKHTWNTAKDILPPDGNTLDGVRWVVVYTKSRVYNVSIYVGFDSIIELITGNMTLYTITGPIGSSPNVSIKYIEIPSITNIYDYTLSEAFRYFHALEELRISSTLTSLVAYSLEDCPKLKKVTLPETLLTISSAILSNAYSLKNIILPSSISSITSGICNHCHNLESLAIPDSVVNMGSGFAMCVECYNLKSLIFSNNIKKLNCYFGHYCYNLETLILPSNLEELVQTYSQTGDRLYSLKYLKLPNTLKAFKNHSQWMTYTEYIELFEDFDFSGIYFNSDRNASKSRQWFKDLCIWLKDKTGETPNTMILGSENITSAENIWLTFNPNDKRDITWVDAGTEGAINIVQFITEQLNWTLS